MTKPMSHTDLAELRRMDLAHHLPAHTDYQVQQQLGGSRIIVRAENSTIEDAEGNKLLDAMAGLWCVNVGYGRKELAAAAYEQMLELPFYNTFFKTATEPAIRLAHEVAERLGNDLTHVFFNNSGSESNDTAFRVAVAFKNLQIIARERLVERVAEDVGPYLSKALSRLNAHPLAGEVRSLGLIGAVEIVSRKGTNERFGGKEGHAGPAVRDACIRNGLMVRAIRDSIVMCPPLIITHAEIDRLVDILDRSLTQAASELRAIPAAA